MLLYWRLVHIINYITYDIKTLLKITTGRIGANSSFVGTSEVKIGGDYEQVGDHYCRACYTYERRLCERFRCVEEEPLRLGGRHRHLKQKKTFYNCFISSHVYKA